MSSPITVMAGMFMLWWAWLGFNCGSTFGVSGDLWKISTLVAVTTLNGAIGGALAGITVSMILHKGHIFVGDITNSTLGGLVGITGAAAVIQPAEAILAGSIGGVIAALFPIVMEKLKIDDPVGAVAVHMMAGSWGTLVVGFFGRAGRMNTLRGVEGLFQKGRPYLLMIQVFGLVTIVLWSALTTFALLCIIGRCFGLRMSEKDEVLGADWVDHGIQSNTLPNRLEEVLCSLDEKYWTDFVQKLPGAITTNNTGLANFPPINRILENPETRARFTAKIRPIEESASAMKISRRCTWENAGSSTSHKALKAISSLRSTKRTHTDDDVPIIPIANTDECEKPISTSTMGLAMQLEVTHHH